MKKIIGGVVGVVVLGLLGAVGFVAMQPAEFHLERSITVAASPADVAPWVSDLKRRDAWSPWNALDPEMKKTWSKSTDEVGSWTAWDGNDDVGAGTQSISRLGDGELEESLHFERPFESDAVVLTSWKAVDGGTEVTWAMSYENDFMGKALDLVMDMDGMLGADFEKGLGLLKPLAEKSRADREAAEEKARLEAEALAAGEPPPQ